MNYKSILSNMSVAFLAQGAGMVFGMLQSLIVPKLLGVEQFGYWQLFIFYTGYVGMFHLGLNDGVYLKTGGQSRDVINKRVVFSQFIVGICFQTIIAAATFIIAAAVGTEANRLFVIACTCMMIVILNAVNYICSVLQAMNETKRSSYVVVASRIAYIIPLLFFLFLRVESFQPYVIAYVLATLLSLVYGMMYVRDFAANGMLDMPASMDLAADSIRVGVNLMVSNIASGLVVGAARFLIDARWGITTFGQLSLSLSMVNLFFIFVNQASLVLFPALRQSDKREMRSFFFALRDTMSLFMPIIYLLYFPFTWVLSLWLPAYAESLSAFAFLIPICAFDGKMDIYCATYFKVVRKERLLLKINILAMLFGAVGSLAGAYVFNSVNFILIWMVITIMGRSTVSDYLVSKSLNLEEAGISLQEVVITALFIVFTQLFPNSVTIPLYAALYFVFLCVNRKRAQALLSSARNAVN